MSFISAINIFLNSVLNANRKLGTMAMTQVVSAFIAFLVAYPLLTLLAAEMSFVSILFALHCCWFIFNSYALKYYGIKLGVLSSFSESFEKANLRQFRSLASASFIVGVSGVLTILFVRLMVEDKYGVASLGIFDAAWTLGTIYLVFILSSFGTFVLPAFSSLNEIRFVSPQFNKIVPLILSVFLPLIITMLTFNEFILSFFYSKEFVGSKELLSLFLVGDVFKILSWCLSILFLAFNKSLVFVVTSLLWNLLFIVQSYYGLNIYGLEGLGFAYITTQIINLVCLYLIVTNKFGVVLRKKVILLSIAVILVVVITAILNSNGSNYLLYAGLMISYFSVVAFFFRVQIRGYVSRRF